MNTKIELGRRLKLARTRSGLTLQDVCDRVPLLANNPSKLGNYERGDREPDLDMLKALAKALHADFAWLATFIDEEPDQREVILTHYYRGSDTRGKDSILRTAEIQSRYGRAMTGEDMGDPPMADCG